MPPSHNYVKPENHTFFEDVDNEYIFTMYWFCQTPASMTSLVATLKVSYHKS